MPTPMGMVYLKRQLKAGFRSPLSLGGNEVKDETVPAIVAVGDYFRKSVMDAPPIPKPNVVDSKAMEHFQKPFDLLSTHSHLKPQNRQKFTNPETAEIWCHAVIQQRWYQCIGGNGGKLQMCAEDIRGYANDGLYHLDENNVSLRPRNNRIHDIALRVWAEFLPSEEALSQEKPSQEGEEDILPSFKYPGNRIAPIAIFPETLEHLPLSTEDRVRYYELVTNVWDKIFKIPTMSKNVVPAWAPRKQIVRKSRVEPSLMSYLVDSSILKEMENVMYEMQTICIDIHDDLQRYMTRNYNPTELAEIDKEWHVELSIDNCREKEEHYRLCLEEETSFESDIRAPSNEVEDRVYPYPTESDETSPRYSLEDTEVSLALRECSSSSDTFHSIESDKPAKPNSIEAALKILLTPSKSFDWADDVIEAATRQEVDEKTNGIGRQVG